MLAYSLIKHFSFACSIYRTFAKKGPWAARTPYIGSRLGSGPILEVSLSQLDAKERPGKLPTRSSLFEY